MISERHVKLYPAQWRFFRSGAKIAAFVGGIQSGKTFVGILWAISQAQAKDRSVLVVAPTYPMLRDIDWQLALDFLGDAARVYRGQMTVDIRGGGRILFRSGTDPDRLRGISVNAALIDEAAYCDEKVYDVVLGRLSKEPGLLRIVTTPRGRNWLYRRGNEMHIERASVYDNAANLPADYITALEASYTGGFARQELFGEFVAHEGLVYYMFDRQKHVKKSVNVDRWFLGVDEGFVNPAVVLCVGADRDGHVHVAHEWYRRGQLQDAVVSTCASFAKAYNIEAIVVDSSAAGLIAALRDMNLPAVPHKTVTGVGLSGVRAGISRLQAMLSADPPQLTVSPECVCTISEFESYAWKESRDEPQKQSDHAMDALRYVVDYLAPAQTRGDSLFAIGERR